MVVSTFNKIKNLFRKKLILVGSRNNLWDIIDAAAESGYHIIGILDSHFYGNTTEICGIPVIGSEQELLDVNSKWRKFNFFPANWWDGKQALGKGVYDGERLRKERIDLLDRSGVKVVNLINERKIHWFNHKRNLKLGKGILMLSNARVGADVTIGDYSVIDWDSGLSFTTVGRNSVIGVDSILAHCAIGDDVRIGVRSVLIPSRAKRVLSVGDRAIVYIGSTVLDDVAADSVYTMHGKTRARFKKSS
jgi:bifunctional N-acetylglucosamine-1-phosphate-uridyltransferase/glucosamine-1-phosphate-acetyltransferase GlmU-like protein